MTDALLTVEALEAVYGGSIWALRGLSLRVPQGSIVALLGANGSGKTTTLKAISCLIGAERGRVVRGSVHYRGEDITDADPADLVEAGLIQVLEGRHCFPHLTVEENLLMGALSVPRSSAELKAELERVYSAFPRLRDKRGTRAGYTSGGEQQMVAIGRALLARPQLILLDEPSMGLAPQVVEEIFDIVQGLNRNQGTSFLIAEQNAAMALAYASYGYIVENGRIPSEGSAAELQRRSDVKELYLGGADAPENRERTSRPAQRGFSVRW